jgi:hypothetical protein
VGWALIATGQLDEAEQRLETTLEAARRADMPHWEAMVFPQLLKPALANAKIYDPWS